VRLLVRSERDRLVQRGRILTDDSTATHRYQRPVVAVAFDPTLATAGAGKNLTQTQAAQNANCSASAA
jgi:hypothetical protein